MKLKKKIAIYALITLITLIGLWLNIWSFMTWKKLSWELSKTEAIQAMQYTIYSIWGLANIAIPVLLGVFAVWLWRNWIEVPGYIFYMSEVKRQRREGRKLRAEIRQERLKQQKDQFFNQKTTL